MKKKISLLLLFTFFTACSNLTTQPQKSDFKTKALEALPSSGPTLDISELPDPPKLNPLNDPKESRKEEPKPNFDILPPENLETVDGDITVIYKNNAKIRLDKSGKNLTSLNNTDSVEVDNLLKKNGLLGGSDIGSKIFSDEKLDLMQKEYQEKNNVDIPNLRSIHYYRLPKGTDTKTLCKTLMKLPYVRLAYPTPKVKTNTLPEVPPATLGFTQPNETTPLPFSDPELNNTNLQHYWFNEHQAFKGWNYFISYNTSLPKLAVIDSGFNANSAEITYTSGYAVKRNSYGYSDVDYNGSPTCLNNLCVQETVVTARSYSHGEAVASVAAARRENGIGGAGIIPYATILPIKTDGQTSSIADSIMIAANDNSVDAINLSYGFDYGPISLDSTMNAAISYAVQGDSGRIGKPVAISASNSRMAIKSYVLSEAVVVGGTMPASLSSDTNKFIAWVNPISPNLGSNYYDISQPGSNVTDIAAGAHQIGIWNYDILSGNSTYENKNGNSLSTPMVTATLGMMRRLNPTLSSKKLKDILIFSSTLRRFDNSNTNPGKFIGKYLQDPNVNLGLVAGIRDLNVFNALVIAKNISSYSAITRSYNIDDYVTGTNSTYYDSYSPSYSVDGYGKDYIYGLTLTGGTYLNFINFNSGGGCAYGYQVYTNQNYYLANTFDKLGGVSGVWSTQSGCYPSNWAYQMSYFYY